MRHPVPPVMLAAATLMLLAATPNPAGLLTLKHTSRLWFDGTSTVRSWSCSADQIDAAISTADRESILEVLEGRKVTGTVQLDFPVAKLECKNGTMNEHMRKALKATDAPVIRFQLTSYELVKGSGVSGTLQGALLLGGQSRPVTVPVQFAQGDGGLRITGKVPVKMTDWGIKPPTLMLGTLKVGEAVTVTFDLLLQQ